MNLYSRLPTVKLCSDQMSLYWHYDCRKSDRGSHKIYPSDTEFESYAELPWTLLQYFFTSCRSQNFLSQGDVRFIWWVDIHSSIFMKGLSTCWPNKKNYYKSANKIARKCIILVKFFGGFRYLLISHFLKDIELISIMSLAYVSIISLGRYLNFFLWFLFSNIC